MNYNNTGIIGKRERNFYLKHVCLCGDQILNFEHPAVTWNLYSRARS